MDIPGLTYSFFIVFVQRDHADFPGAGCVGQLNCDVLVRCNDSIVLPVSQTSGTIVQGGNEHRICVSRSNLLIPLVPIDSADFFLCHPPNIFPDTTYPQVDLDAIKCKICHSLAEDFLHFPADDGPQQPMLWQTILLQAASLSPPTPANMDALEMKIL